MNSHGDCSENSFPSSFQQVVHQEALNYLKEVKARFREQPEKLNMFRRVMKDVSDFMANRDEPDFEHVSKLFIHDVSARVKEILGDHKDLLEGYNSFLPESHQIRKLLDVDEEEFKSALNFVGEVKMRDGAIYENFLTVVTEHMHNLKSSVDLFNEIRTLFADYKDLQDGFMRFMPNLDATEPSTYHDCRSLSKEQKLEQRVERGGNRNHDKHNLKSIKEPDPSKERCTPSYRLLLDEYPLPSGQQVLNYHWECVPSKIQFYSKMESCPNFYEKIMFQWEDDRFVLDMLLNWYESASNYAEELLNDTNEDVNSGKDEEDEGDEGNDNEGVKKHETDKTKRIYFLRSVERLYGEHGLDMLDEFYKDPESILPIILFRLNQKIDELKKYRLHLNELGQMCKPKMFPNRN